MKSNILLVLLIVIVLYCHQPNQQDKMRDINQFVKSEIEKWKKELLISGDVGGPCEDDYVKWNEKYPESYYGLPDTIQFKTVDMNDDGKDDILLYFPAGEACTGGHEEGSDFLKLIYSSKNEYLQNNDLRATIEKEIRFLSDRQTGAFSRRAIFSVTNIDKQIIGTFQVWTDDDPDCCAGYEGTFEYNPFKWKMELKQHKVQ